MKLPQKSTFLLKKWKEKGMKEVENSLLDTIQLKVCYGHETIMKFVNHTIKFWDNPINLSHRVQIDGFDFKNIKSV